MPVSLEHLVTELFALYRAYPTGIVCSIILISGVIIDVALNSDGREKLSKVILGARDSIVYVPDGVEIPRRVEITNLFLAALDRLFAFKGKAVRFPGIVRSVVASVCVLTIYLALSPEELLVDLKNTPPAVLLTVLLANVAVDYLSLTETRWLIGTLARLRSSSAYFLALVADLIISILLIYLLYIALAILVAIEGPNRYEDGSTNVFLNALPENRNVLIAAAINFYDLFTTPDGYWRSTHQVHLTLILTNLTTSIWLWIFSVGAVLQVILRSPMAIRNYLHKYTIFSSRPATLSAALVSLLCFIILVPYNQLIQHTLAKNYSLEPQTRVLTEPPGCESWDQPGLTEDRGITLQVRPPIPEQAEPSPADTDSIAGEEPAVLKPLPLQAAGRPYCHLEQITYEVEADSPGIPESARKLLRRLAVLMRSKNIRVRIEGHVERLGGRAYNMAAAERLANAASSLLVNEYGAPGLQIETVSYGGEKTSDMDPEGIRPSHPSLRRVVIRVLSGY